MKTDVIYIAGKMTGIKDWNYPEFRKAQRKLEKKGFIVINPIDIFESTFGKPRHIDGAEYELLFEKIEKALNCCDFIYLLKGWESSIGAKKELKIALDLNIQILLQE